MITMYILYKVDTTYRFEADVCDDAFMELFASEEDAVCELNHRVEDLCTPDSNEFSIEDIDTHCRIAWYRLQEDGSNEGYIQYSIVPLEVKEKENI